MKNALLKTMMCAGLTGMMLAGCANDDVYDPNATSKQYQANWEKQFGDIDPQQTWNTAATHTADISIGYSGKYTLKIYTANPRSQETQAYLLGRYDVEGGKSYSLQFDMPSSLTNIYVALADEDGGQIIKSAPISNSKASVVFGTYATTKGFVGTENDNFSKTDAIHFTKEAYNNFLDIIPEGDTENVNKTELLHSNFNYKSKGSFIIYPMYTVTNGTPTLGVYYKLPGQNEWNSRDLWSRENIRIMLQHEWGYQEADWFGWTSDALNNSAFAYSICKGIQINLPVGTEFGFYCRNGNYTFYSEKAKNPENKCYFATFNNGYQINNKDVIFLGVEDSPMPADHDLNDIVCAIAGETEKIPDIVDKDQPTDTDMKYLIACEDLGGSDDFDFNDIVLAINHVSGTKTASVELLAAGGTLPAKVMYENTTIFEEVHEAFGVPTSTLVNTGGTTRPAVMSNPIDVPDNFSVSTHASKFKIIVTKGGHSSVEISVPDKNGATPQAFVIADPNWKWPNERQNITEKYPEFSDWVKDHAKDNWYNAQWNQ